MGRNRAVKLRKENVQKYKASVMRIGRTFRDERGEGSRDMGQQNTLSKFTQTLKPNIQK